MKDLFIALKARVSFFRFSDTINFLSLACSKLWEKGVLNYEFIPNIWDQIGRSLVTQPMLQLRPNCTELRSMDYYHQIFCRFQKCKRKVPPPSLLSNDFEKSCFFSKKLVMIFFQNWHFLTLDGIFEIKVMMKKCLGVIRFGIGVLRKELG